MSQATGVTGGPAAAADRPSGRPDAIKAVPLRHPWRWLSAAIVLAITAELVYTIVTAPNLRWEVVGQYLFGDLIVRGALLTLELTVIAMAIGIVLGVVLAVMRLSPNPVVSSVSWFYIW